MSWNDDKCSPIEAFCNKMQLTFCIIKDIDQPHNWKESSLNIDQKHYFVFQTICVAIMFTTSP
jgi:hypothetical protein